MHILTTSSASQDIKIKPRTSTVSGDTIVVLTSKSKRKSVNYTVTNSFNSTTNIMTLSGEFLNLILDSYYTFVVKDDNGELYRGMIYVTNQTDYNKYEVGKGDYIQEDSYDNEFVFLD